MLTKQNTAVASGTCYAIIYAPKDRRGTAHEQPIFAACVERATRDFLWIEGGARLSRSAIVSISADRAEIRAALARQRAEAENRAAEIAADQAAAQAIATAQAESKARDDWALLRNYTASPTAGRLAEIQRRGLPVPVSAAAV